MTSNAVQLDASQIGARLKSARKFAGLSQVEAANAIGIDSVTLSRYERGRLVTPRATLMALASVYQQDVAAIETDEVELGYVPRDTATSLANEFSAGYRLSSGERWEPNPNLRGLIPQRVYDVALSYCQRLAAAGLPREEVEEAERLLVDPAYAKLNRRARRELTEDEQIQIIDATWGIMQEVLSWKGVRA